MCILVIALNSTLVFFLRCGSSIAPIVCPCVLTQKVYIRTRSRCWNFMAFVCKDFNYDLSFVTVNWYHDIYFVLNFLLMDSLSVRCIMTIYDFVYGYRHIRITIMSFIDALCKWAIPEKKMSISKWHGLLSVQTWFQGSCLSFRGNSNRTFAMYI